MVVVNFVAEVENFAEEEAAAEDLAVVAQVLIEL